MWPFSSNYIFGVRLYGNGNFAQAISSSGAPCRSPFTSLNFRHFWVWNFSNWPRSLIIHLFPAVLNREVFMFCKPYGFPTPAASKLSACHGFVPRLRGVNKFFTRGASWARPVLLAFLQLPHVYARQHKTKSKESAVEGISTLLPDEKCTVSFPFVHNIPESEIEKFIFVPSTLSEVCVSAPDTGNKTARDWGWKVPSGRYLEGSI